MPVSKVIISGILIYLVIFDISGKPVLPITISSNRACLRLDIALSALFVVKIGDIAPKNKVVLPVWNHFGLYNPIRNIAVPFPVGGIILF